MLLAFTTAVCLALLNTSYYNAGLPDAPFTHFLTWAAFVFTALFDLSYCFYHRPFRPRPILACAITFAITAMVPFENYTRAREFHRDLAVRQAIAQRVQQGDIRPVGDPTGLCIYAPHREIDGHQIALIDTTGAPATFFSTYQSSDYCEGWLYLPDGVTPINFRRHRHPFTPNWDFAK